MKPTSIEPVEIAISKPAGMKSQKTHSGLTPGRTDILGWAADDHDVSTIA
jgi:hypothetical protein